LDTHFIAKQSPPASTFSLLVDKTFVIDGVNHFMCFDGGGSVAVEEGVGALNIFHRRPTALKSLRGDKRGAAYSGLNYGPYPVLGLGRDPAETEDGHPAAGWLAG
jgi:hypothetical protein